MRFICSLLSIYVTDFVYKLGRKPAQAGWFSQVEGSLLPLKPSSAGYIVRGTCPEIMKSGWLVFSILCMQ